jgi:hypothetical protein
MIRRVLVISPAVVCGCSIEPTVATMSSDHRNPSQTLRFSLIANAHPHDHEPEADQPAGQAPQLARAEHQ